MIWPFYVAGFVVGALLMGSLAAYVITDTVKEDGWWGGLFRAFGLVLVAPVAALLGGLLGLTLVFAYQQFGWTGVAVWLALAGLEETLRLKPWERWREAAWERRSQANTDDIRAFLQAAQRGDVTTLKQFLDKGLFIDSRFVLDPNYPNTALMAAVRGGHVAAVRLLLNRGADPKIGDMYGRTAADLAAQSQNNALLELLRTEQADSRRGLQQE